MKARSPSARKYTFKKYMDTMESRPSSIGTKPSRTNFQFDYSPESMAEQVEIISEAAADASESQKKKMKQTPLIDTIIEIVADFLRSSGRVCYGGTAINALLPDEMKFYDPDLDIPDYDFFSPAPNVDMKTLVENYVNKGFTNVEGKPGAHMGTYNVFVNYIKVADITYMPPRLYSRIFEDSIERDGLNYASPDYLRMAAYLELSRPSGQTDRWEKVYKRLMLLNKAHPIKTSACENAVHDHIVRTGNVKEIQGLVPILNKFMKNFVIENDVVMFGARAIEFYNIMGDSSKRVTPLNKKKYMFFDHHLLANNPEVTAESCVNGLKMLIGIDRIKMKHVDGFGENIPEHIAISINDVPCIFIYKTVACHSYYEIPYGEEKEGKKLKIATIETMMNFFLAFITAEPEKYNVNAILCAAEYLINLSYWQKINSKSLASYPLTCLGDQPTIEEMRKHKNEKYKEFKESNDKHNFDLYFSTYKAEDVLRKRGKSLRTSPEVIKSPLRRSVHSIKHEGPNTERKTRKRVPIEDFAAKKRVSYRRKSSRKSKGSSTFFKALFNKK
jgi:hypothetical protein